MERTNVFKNAQV